MGFQFVHIETYARKADRLGRSTAWVLDEAERREGSCPHVAAPQPAEIVHGMALADVRRLHDQAAESHVVTLANGKTRALRRDQKSLVTVVASHPATMEEVRANPSIAADVAAWEQRTVDWLAGRYGDRLLSVVRHTDEAHAHLHAYIVPDDLRASRLHPGVEAKRLLVEAGPQDGEDAKALNRKGDAAYKAALREWQDSYWQHVGLPSGLTRLGPARRRLTREEWHAERVACRAAKEAAEQAAEIEQQAVALLLNTKADAAAHVASVKARTQEIISSARRQADKAKRLHDAALLDRQKARSMIGAAKSEARRVLSLARSESIRLRSFGSRLRRFWDGLQRSSIRDALRREAAADVAHLKSCVDDVARRLDGEVRQRREAERRAADASASARVAGRDRDRLRRELDALRPAPATGIRPELKPSGRGP